jgi:hypothetical protein
VTGTAVEKRLTARQQQIAMLDAWGYNATEIGKALDCTPAYVRATRGKDWFPAERDKWITGGLLQLEPILESLRVRALGVHGEALDELQKMLHAEDSEGNPLYDVRIKAIQIALNHRLIQAITGAVDEGKSIAAAVTQVTLNFFKDEAGNPVLHPDDWIEGEVVDAG